MRRCYYFPSKDENRPHCIKHPDWLLANENDSASHLRLFFFLLHKWKHSIFFIISYDLNVIKKHLESRIRNLYKLTTTLKLSTGVKKLLTFFSSLLRRKEEKDGKEVASSESKMKQRKIQNKNTKNTKIKKRKAGVGKRESERASAC